MLPHITISGFPGSGTSTAARLLSRKLGYKSMDAGAIFRAMAKERGMDVVDFRELVSEQPEIDHSLDARMVTTAKEAAEPMILEARLIAWMTYREKIPAFRVWIKAPDEMRYQRIARRENLSMEDARAKTMRREANEIITFQRLYGIDLHDTSIYDMVIANDQITPGMVRDKILQGYQAYVRKYQTRPNRPRTRAD